jgi:hypothetical protein
VRPAVGSPEFYVMEFPLKHCLAEAVIIKVQTLKT